jgi:hypothetical protein
LLVSHIVPAMLLPRALARLKIHVTKFKVNLLTEPYCNPANKVSLGFMAGLNNKIRVIQRRAYGIKDQRYLKLKVLTSFIQDP